MSELVLRRLLVERSLLTEKIERAAVAVARDWLVAHKLDHVRVDDENPNPSFARDYDDEMLDMAVGNMSASLFTNPTRPAWNPELRLTDLHAYLGEK